MSAAKPRAVMKRRQEEPEVKATQDGWDWDSDATNPYNWSSGTKAWQVAMISSIGFQRMNPGPPILRNP